MWFLFFGKKLYGFFIWNQRHLSKSQIDTRAHPLQVKEESLGKLNSMIFFRSLCFFLLQNIDKYIKMNFSIQIFVLIQVS